MKRDYPGLSRWALNAITSVHTRGKQKAVTEEKAKQRGRDWSDVATSPGIPGQPAVVEVARDRVLPTIHFQASSLQTVRE